MSRKERCSLKVTQCSSVEEAVTKLREGTVEAAFFVEAHYDSPPGDWYIQFEIVCPDLAVAERVAQASLPVVPRVQRDGLWVIKGAYITALCGRDVVRRTWEETAEFLAGWDPEVAEKAALISERLSAA